MSNNHGNRKEKIQAIFGVTLTILFFIAMFFAFASLGNTEEMAGFCTQTASNLFAACKAGVTDDQLVTKANCINISDAAARSECLGDAEDTQKEDLKLCRDQRDWRLDACKLLGEDRYDPQIDPANFESDYTHLQNPNPFFPLTIGNTWKYKSSDGETNIVEATSQTKLIEGVTCIVLRDKVFADGFLQENTDDWFCQAKDKTTWYFGEEVKDYEVFDGDKPKRPELVEISGSFKAGRDNSKPGIIFLPNPKKGDVYLEEFSLGNAEDLTQILSTNYSFGKNANLDRFVPQQLANRFCHDDCVVTRNISLLEPGVEERKYYTRGIGVFLEVELTNGVSIPLIDCNFDSRCQGLPTP